MKTLTPREAQVIRMRFGIDMNTEHTLAEVAVHLGLSCERVRQIQATALRKLADSPLSDYIVSD